MTQLQQILLFRVLCTKFSEISVFYSLIFLLLLSFYHFQQGFQQKWSVCAFRLWLMFACQMITTSQI